MTTRYNILVYVTREIIFVDVALLVQLDICHNVLIKS